MIGLIAARLAILAGRLNHLGSQGGSPLGYDGVGERVAAHRAPCGILRHTAFTATLRSSPQCNSVRLLRARQHSAEIDPRQTYQDSGIKHSNFHVYCVVIM